MKYALEFRPLVLKSLRNVAKRDLLRIKKKIDELSDNLRIPVKAASRTDLMAATVPL